MREIRRGKLLMDAFRKGTVWIAASLLLGSGCANLKSGATASSERDLRSWSGTSKINPRSSRSVAANKPTTQKPEQSDDKDAKPETPAATPMTPDESFQLARNQLLGQQPPAQTAVHVTENDKDVEYSLPASLRVSRPYARSRNAQPDREDAPTARREPKSAAAPASDAMANTAMDTKPAANAAASASPTADEPPPPPAMMVRNSAKSAVPAEATRSTPASPADGEKKQDLLVLDAKLTIPPRSTHRATPDGTQATPSSATATAAASQPSNARSARSLFRMPESNGFSPNDLAQTPPAAAAKPAAAPDTTSAEKFEQELAAASSHPKNNSVAGPAGVSPSDKPTNSAPKDLAATAGPKPERLGLPSPHELKIKKVPVPPPPSSVAQDSKLPGPKGSATGTATAGNKAEVTVASVEGTTQQSVLQPTSALEEGTGHRDVVALKPSTTGLGTTGSAVPSAPTPFALANLSLCYQVFGFGKIERRQSDSFAPGESVLIYSEVENFDSIPTPNGYLTRMATRVVLENEEGVTIVPMDFGQLTDECLAKRNDFYCHFSFALPSDLPTGRYQLRIKLKDLHSMAITEDVICINVQNRTR